MEMVSVLKSENKLEGRDDNTTTKASANTALITTTIRSMRGAPILRTITRRPAVRRISQDGQQNTQEQ